jgi:hypothetical protein
VQFASAMMRAFAGDNGSPDVRKKVPLMSRPRSRAARHNRTADEAVVLSQAGVPRERHAASQSTTMPALDSATNSGYGIGRPAHRLTRDTACVSAAFFASWRIEIGVCENQRSSG